MKYSAKGENIKGMKFGRWTAISFYSRSDKNGRNSFLWNCKCDCGKMGIIDKGSLKSGNSRSCGCYHRESTSIKNTTHGQLKNYKKTPEYRAWQHMKDRCYNSNDSSFHNYGGRGITVCERWSGINGFKNFITDIGQRPSTKHSLDRFPDNGGSYSPYNCRWATRQQQSRNRRNNVWIKYNGENKILVDWLGEFGMKRSFFNRRIKKGMNANEIFNQISV